MKNGSPVNQSVLKEKNRGLFSLEQDQYVSEKLLSEVIHKIKNSLGGIGGFAALLERDLGSDDPRSRLVQRIQDGVGRLNEFVIDLMTLVRSAEPCFEKIQIRSILKEVWKNYWGNEERLNDHIVFHPEIQDEKVALFADQQMIQQVFLHAIRFADLIGENVETIRVNPHSDNEICIELLFMDSTCPKNLCENINRLVDKCEPIEARLSLAIVIKMVNLHGGKVSIKSLSKKQKVMKLQLIKGS